MKFLNYKIKSLQEYHSKIRYMKRSITILLTILFLFSGTSIFMSCENNEHKEQTNQIEEDVYACPNHHGTTGKKGDYCETCGVPLTSTKTDPTHKDHNH